MERYIALVEVTEDNVDALVNIALSMYVGEKCPYCQREFKTLEDLEGAVVAPHNQTAHKECWDTLEEKE